MISSSDFYNWKQDPVTKQFFDACFNREFEAKEKLAATAGLDSAEDNFTRGFIRAYSEIQSVTFGDMGEQG